MYRCRSSTVSRYWNCSAVKRGPSSSPLPSTATHFVPSMCMPWIICSSPTAPSDSPKPWRSRAPDRLLIRDRSNVHVIPIDDVDYVESQDDYISIRAGGKSYLKEQAISDLEQQLSPKAFLS